LTSSVNAADQSTISLSGTGVVEAQPDEGYITLGVNTKAATSAEAVRDNTKAMQSVYEALSVFEIQKKDVQTTQFSVQQNYKYIKDEQGNRNAVPDGFVVTNMVRITVCNLDQFGKVLDAVVQNGANVVHGITFGSSKADELLDEARARAVADALRKARIYTKGLDVSLGDVLTITESGSYNQPNYKYARMAMVAEAASDVPVSGGSLSFSMTVSIVWEIERADKPRIRIKPDNKLPLPNIGVKPDALNKKELKN